MTEPNAIPQGPLAGVKVIDFSNFIAGCYGAMLLGDYGAEIVKIEALYGDAARYWGPFFKGESRFFQGWNRNKRSVAVDLLSEDGRAIIYELVKDADVVVENFRKGVTAKLKIDYETLRKMNPKLIYCSITAFGTTGPDSDRPGYDPILQSLTGAARGNERYSGSVSICSVAISDFGAGMLGAGAISAALYRRERSGEGQLIETSLLQAAMTQQSHMFVEALDAEEEPPFGIFPYTFFETKDDRIFVAAPTDRFWKLLCEAMGDSDLGADLKYATNPDRVAHRDELFERVQSHLKMKTTAAWETILLDIGVPCAPALTYEEFFRDPQVAAMEMNPVVEHSVIGPMRVSGVPVNFRGTPGAIQCAAPALGEHTDAVLVEIGYDGERIAQLREDGVIK